jgi:hypothetical protein
MSETDLGYPGAIDAAGSVRIAIREPTPQPAVPDYKIGWAGESHLEFWFRLG